MYSNMTFTLIRITA